VSILLKALSILLLYIGVAGGARLAYLSFCALKCGVSNTIAFNFLLFILLKFVIWF